MATRGAWKKASPEAVDRFHAALPEHPAAERRKMFGYPAPAIASDDERLADLLARGIAAAATLPPKEPKQRKARRQSP